MSILYYLGIMQWLILKVGPPSWLWDGGGKQKNLLASLTAVIRMSQKTWGGTNLG